MIKNKFMFMRKRINTTYIFLPLLFLIGGGIIISHLLKRK